MEKNSSVHQHALRYCYHEYASDPELALNRLKSKSTVAEFHHMCDKLITTIHHISVKEVFADFVFLPRANAGNRPAMIVELKYNHSADTAIRQIKEKRYQGALVGYEGKILLVGISYDSEKHHTCSIKK